MRWISRRWLRPQHPRWLAACVFVLLLTVWSGGMSFWVVAVFAVIFATGAALLSSVFPVPPAPEWAAAEDDADSPVDQAEDAQPVPE